MDIVCAERPAVERPAFFPWFSHPDRRREINVQPEIKPGRRPDKAPALWNSGMEAARILKVMRVMGRKKT
jgi:hypothetical protein